MIVSLCGKSGCGKSTIAALLASEFTRSGKRVLVVDSDDSDKGLHSKLGISLPNNLLDYFGGRTAIRDRVSGSEIEPSFFEQTWTMDCVPQEYVGTKDGIKLVSIVKSRVPGEECDCARKIITRQFLENLRLSCGEVVILDTETGAENFGKGAEVGVDAVLLVEEPCAEALPLSEMLSQVSGNIHKPVYIILNKVDSGCDKAALYAAGEQGRVISIIPASMGKSFSESETGKNPLGKEYGEIKNLAYFLHKHIR